MGTSPGARTTDLRIQSRRVETEESTERDFTDLEGRWVVEIPRRSRDTVGSGDDDTGRQ